ncbi:MAG TPA: homocysteine S-methyltransferase family protein, partial [Thermoguttaceae bacterium]|nr:homocysteine S-methyltransferase family protein [Thermoguttaceae bacterium]
MHRRLESFLAAGPLLTDGAWGTQLQQRGLAMGECPDAWNLTHPEKVQEVAAAYVAAGSDIILTNTFGANRVRLAEFGLTDNVVEINRQGAAISKRAAGTSAKVFASIGPSGKLLLMGDVTEDELTEAFAVQAAALRDGGADALVIETMTDLAEAKLALAAAQTTGLPVVLCLVFDMGGHTMMGVSPAQAARELTDLGADVIGANCGNGIEQYVGICEQLHAATHRPIWIKAN